MQFQPRFSRFIALSTGAAIACATLFQAAPARADKAKNLKYGAIGLGVVSAYLFSKGKTAPAATAAAGGYYAYKKSQDAKNEARYGSDRYGTNAYPDSSGAVYPDSDSGYEPQYRSNASVRENKRSGKIDLRPYLR